MESTLQYLGQGFVTAFSLQNLLWVTFGGLLGTIIGMLPGIGPATGVAILIPITFSMNPITALVTMCAVYYGAMFGGSRSSILINTPGDGSAIAATFDGYPMAMNGKAGTALAVSGMASFIGGLIGIIVLTFLASPVAKFALKFGPPQYFALMVFALSATITISQGSLLKGMISMFFGLMLGTIGIDLQSGIPRFAMGIPELQDGIDFLVIILGIYAVGEVFRNYASLDQVSQALSENFGRIWITRLEWRKIVVPILRSTPVGFLIGVLPGAGGTIAAMVAYTNEKQLSKHPEEFGKGVIEGVAAPEAANNAASVGALIPMLTMGIPGSGTTAVMLGALMMLGVKPGPLLFKIQPEIVWGVIASMYIGNVICAILNVPLAGILVRLLYIPKKVLMPIILGLGFIGAYTLNYSIVDFYLLVTAGVAGLLMNKLKMPTTPLILALILGNMIEQSFRQALTISKGSFVIFVGDPISVILLLLAIGSVLYALVSHRRLKKRIAA